MKNDLEALTAQPAAREAEWKARAIAAEAKVAQLTPRLNAYVTGEGEDSAAKTTQEPKI
jgi:hypothetical protein